MRTYLIPAVLIVILCLPTRPFILAWAWFRSLRPFQQIEGRMVALAAAADHADEPKPPAL